jgi:single-stranded-DNA-specific exonuclease
MLLAFNGEIGRGSGRCTNGVNLRDALGECSDLLEAHGGHAAAAGMEIKRENFPAFCERFAAVCARLAPKEHPYRVDGLAEFPELEPQTIRRMEALGPFGNGHPRPRFVTHGVKIIGNPFVDTRGQHLRVRVAKGRDIMPARVVRGAEHFETLRQNKGPWSIAYTPRISSRSEDGPVQIDIHDLAAGNDPRRSSGRTNEHRNGR